MRTHTRQPSTHARPEHITVQLSRDHWLQVLDDQSCQPIGWVLRQSCSIPSARKMITSNNTRPQSGKNSRLFPTKECVTRDIKINNAVGKTKEDALLKQKQRDAKAIEREKKNVMRESMKQVSKLLPRTSLQDRSRFAEPILNQSIDDTAEVLEKRKMFDTYDKERIERMFQVDTVDAKGQNNNRIDRPMSNSMVSR